MEVRNKTSMSSLTPMRMHGRTGEACQIFSVFAKSTCSSCSTPMRMGTGGACQIFSPFRHSACPFTTIARMTVLWGAVEIFCRINHPSKHYPMSNYSRGRYWGIPVAPIDFPLRTVASCSRWMAAKIPQLWN